MSGNDHSTIAGRELLGIIHELEAEEAVIRDHNKAKSDIIKEAGNKGYDKKTIRKVMAARRLDPLERGEQDNLFDMYMQAIERAEKGSAHARVENIEQFPPHNPETGELTDTQEQPEEPATQSVPVSRVDGVPEKDAGRKTEPGRSAPLESASDKISSTQSPSPETPQATADEEASPPAASSAPNPNPQPNLLPGAVKAPEADSSPASGAVLSEAEIPAFLKADRGFNNPRCKHPDTCSKAHSKDTCIDCTLAWADLPKAEQVLRWQEAVAASETETA